MPKQYIRLVGGGAAGAMHSTPEEGPTPAIQVPVFASLEYKPEMPPLTGDPVQMEYYRLEKLIEEDVSTLVYYHGPKNMVLRTLVDGYRIGKYELDTGKLGLPHNMEQAGPTQQPKQVKLSAAQMKHLVSLYETRWATGQYLSIRHMLEHLLHTVNI